MPADNVAISCLKNSGQITIPVSVSVQSVVEGLKVAAALKLWVDRGYRVMGFGVESDVGREIVLC